MVRSGSILDDLGADLGRSGVGLGRSGSISIDSEGEHADVEQTPCFASPNGSPHDPEAR